MQRWTYRYAHIQVKARQKSILSFIIHFICIFILYVYMILWEDTKRATLEFVLFIHLNKVCDQSKPTKLGSKCLLPSGLFSLSWFYFFEIEFESLAEPRACQFSRTNWPGSAYVFLPCTGITGVHSCSELFKWVLGVWTQILTALGTKSYGAHLSKPSAPISVWYFTWEKKYLIFRALWVTSHPLTYYWEYPDCPWHCAQ